MKKLAQDALFYCFVLVLVYGVLADTLWVRIVCFVIGIPAAILWIGWDWITTVIRDGRTHRG